MHLQILTPEKTAFDGEVESISAPGEVGGFEILKDHAPILSSLIPGDVRLLSGGQVQNFHVSFGFLEFSHNRGVILANAVEKSGEIDMERVMAAKERAEKYLASSKHEVDVARAQRALMRARSREKFVQKVGTSAG